MSTPSTAETSQGSMPIPPYMLETMRRSGALVVGSAIGDWPICEAPEPTVLEVSSPPVSGLVVLSIIERVQSDTRTPKERFDDISRLVEQVKAEHGNTD